jgi:RNA polymerase sigma-70 factor (ECF subfamily)
MDRAFFQELLQKHRDRVFSHARYVLHNREDAEDVAQEVFVKLWEHGRDVDPAKTEAWIMRVTHNACIDCCRRRSRNRKGEDRLHFDSPGAGLNCDDPSVLYELNETQRALLSAMDALPASVRSLILMHYFQDMPMEQIGETVGMTPNAVKVAVHRGRKLLRKTLLARGEPVQERKVP